MLDPSAMTIVTEAITLPDLRALAAAGFGDMVKGVVDVDRELLALDAEMHADLEAHLISTGSNQRSLWGINLYPDEPGDAFVEFDSMINLRPSQGNRGRGVEDPDVRSKIISVVELRVRR